MRSLRFMRRRNRSTIPLTSEAGVTPRDRNRRHSGGRQVHAYAAKPRTAGGRKRANSRLRRRRVIDRYQTSRLGFVPHLGSGPDGGAEPKRCSRTRPVGAPGPWSSVTTRFNAASAAATRQVRTASRAGRHLAGSKADTGRTAAGHSVDRRSGSGRVVPLAGRTGPPRSSGDERFQSDVALVAIRHLPRGALRRPG